MRLNRVVGNETLDVVDLRLESQRRESLGVSTGVSMLWRARHVCRRAVGVNGKYGDEEAEAERAPRPLGGASADADREVREGFLVAPGEKVCDPVAGVRRESYPATCLV